MGNSKPPSAAFDLIDSFARRRGGDIEIVLANPTSEVATSRLLVLQRGAKSVGAPGELIENGDGGRLTARAPRSSLGNGVWALRMRTGTDTRVPLGTRLLVQGERPMVLLWGASTGESEIPKRWTPKHQTLRRRVAAAGGKVLDRVLSLLPPERADKLRSQARTAARRLLG